MEAQKKKVLIVDDNDDICDVFKFHFEHKGFKTFLAATGQEAFECVTRQNPDIVISDIRMPDGDGLVSKPFEFEDRVLHGTCCIRWVRTKPTHDNHPAGLGVRILKLEDDCRTAVINLVREACPSSFIPRH